MPLLGVIEGFYGQAWSKQSRLNMQRWLKLLGMDAYLYAPKSDSYLRKDWRKEWPVEQRRHLLAVARAAETNGLAFHVGLSPFALYEAYDAPARRVLRSRLEGIVDLGVRGVALLFDDMPGGCEALAERQAEICADLRAFAGSARLALTVCPTYYSDDPVLDTVFGTRPPDYLASLCEQLDADWQVFWTGHEVCAPSIDTASLRAAADASAGRLAIWDNYPVNDSRSRCEHLYLKPLSGRKPEVAGLVQSHWCNAMNQPALSLPALASLPKLYGRTAADAHTALVEAGIDETLMEVCLPLATLARSELDIGQLARLHELAEGGGAAARELAAWLRGDYEFDPACLTD